jgi:dGTPase
MIGRSESGTLRVKRERIGKISLDVSLFEAGLSPRAQRSTMSKGRMVAEEPCRARTEYQRDRDRIVHSKSFRRLKHKTQVFIAPEGDHYRTRLTHTLEVSGIARAVARALRLNEDLTEAVALGHDLGHPPFGHAGEEVLDKVLLSSGFAQGFHHNLQSLRVVEVLENDGCGLNLTWEVRDGIAHHTGSMMPATLEGQVVRICDRVAYINHDIDDALRSGLVTPSDLPSGPIALLGRSGSERIDALVHDLIDTSFGRDAVSQSPDVAAAMSDLREFLFATVYGRSMEESGEGRVRGLLEALFLHFLENPESLPAPLPTAPPSAEADAGPGCPCAEEALVRAVTDYIAGMTDRYAMQRYFDFFMPRGWPSPGREGA